MALENIGIDWWVEKHRVPVAVVDLGASTTCPIRRSKLRENGYRKMKCSRCGFKGDRDSIADLNIEKRALYKLQMGGACPLGAPR